MFMFLKKLFFTGLATTFLLGGLLFIGLVLAAQFVSPHPESTPRDHYLFITLTYGVFLLYNIVMGLLIVYVLTRFSWKRAGWFIVFATMPLMLTFLTRAVFGPHAVITIIVITTPAATLFAMYNFFGLLERKKSPPKPVTG